MRDYIEIDIELVDLDEPTQELVLAGLVGFGFEGFIEEQGKIRGYLPAGSFLPGSFESYLSVRHVRDKIKSYRISSVQDQNWNEVWERDYSCI